MMLPWRKTVMSYTADVYTAILADIQNGLNNPGEIATRNKGYSNGTSVVFAIDVITKRREFFVRLNSQPDPVQFPKWHGISIDLAKLPVYGDERCYVRFIQLPESVDYIFDIVVEDLRQAVEKTASIETCLPTILSILAKWKRFFQSERPLVMPDDMQEGLFGELIFLRLMIENIGTKAVKSWVGSERETHDFYFLNHAVEVKTTSRKEPYSFQISSEYQLDESDVSGMLFLYAMALRKSKQSGMRIPELISAIRDELIGDVNMLDLFNDKILRYGFIDGTEELYTLSFSIRDHYVFEIGDRFPRIIRSMFQQGVAKVSYEILASQCLPFCRTEEQLIHILKGGALDA